MKINILLILWIVCSVAISAQHYISLDVSNQPYDRLYLVKLRGDKSSVVDTIYLTRGGFYYRIPEAMETGVYRIFFSPLRAGQKQKNQYCLDFIYNHEDIKLKTDYNHLLDSIHVIYSQENKEWFSFFREYKKFTDEIKKSEPEINFFQKNPDNPNYTYLRKKAIIEEFNQAQRKRDLYLINIYSENPGLFVSRLIRMYKEPFQDGNKSIEERRRYERSNYFDSLDFSDKTLINSSVYTSSVFRYFMLYAQKGLSKEVQEKEFEKAIDVILKQTKSNADVSVFIVDYLMRGFESLGLDNLLSYLSSNYMVPHGCSGDIETIERKLAFQKLQSGSHMSDFSLKDLSGIKTSLSQFDTSYKLVLFWETTCPACKELLPQLKSWYLNRNVDLEVFAISIDEDTKQWKSFLTHYDYPWINLSDPHKWDGATASAYYVYATPTMYLLDGNNDLVAKCISFEEVMDAIHSL